MATLSITIFLFLFDLSSQDIIWGRLLVYPVKTCVPAFKVCDYVGVDIESKHVGANNLPFTKVPEEPVSRVSLLTI